MYTTGEKARKRSYLSLQASILEGEEAVVCLLKRSESRRCHFLLPLPFSLLRLLQSFGLDFFSRDPTVPAALFNVLSKIESVLWLSTLQLRWLEMKKERLN